ncbi:MAG TPA: hypothetical protein VJ874_00890 [Candidatus Thermoplasmatota archaeon]|nr:hypothetical protein [Candidatus Thermoplasmatota archaeon]
MDDSGLLGTIAAVAILAVVGVVALGAFAYSTDYTLSADVKGKECGLGALNVVSVETRALGIDHDVEGVPQRECSFIEVGDQVDYRIRSKHTTIYRDGDCVYDSVSGPGCGAGPLAFVV